MEDDHAGPCESSDDGSHRIDSYQRVRNPNLPRCEAPIHLRIFALTEGPPLGLVYASREVLLHPVDDGELAGVQLPKRPNQAPPRNRENQAGDPKDRDACSLQANMSSSASEEERGSSQDGASYRQEEGIHLLSSRDESLGARHDELVLFVELQSGGRVRRWAPRH